MSCMKGLTLCALPHPTSTWVFITVSSPPFVSIDGVHGLILSRAIGPLDRPCAQTQKATRRWLLDLADGAYFMTIAAESMFLMNGFPTAFR
jgi:hypothetical protein